MRHLSRAFAPARLYPDTVLSVWLASLVFRERKRWFSFNGDGRCVPFGGGIISKGANASLGKRSTTSSSSCLGPAVAVLLLGSSQAGGEAKHL